MRLIDADALKEAMYHKAFETDSDMQKWDSGCWIRYKMFENAIQNAPTIEAEPKRGKWLKLYKNNYKCSVCGSWWVCCDNNGIAIKDFNYCPNCGAKMSSEVE